MSARQRNTRVADLLAEKATLGLDPAAQTELENLIGETVGSDTDSLELAAAVLELACLEAGHDRMPKALTAKVVADAMAFFAS